MLIRAPRRRELLALVVGLVLPMGCATQTAQQTQQAQEIQHLQARLEEAERTNGRLAVRIEELEDDVFLLQDRVDANRIALQRRGIMGPQATGNTYSATRPAPAPETHWNDAQAANPYVQPTHPVTRIPLGGERPAPNYAEQVPTSQIPPTTSAAPASKIQDDGESELVIGENEFRAFERTHGGSTRTASSSSSSSSPRDKAAQPNVTEERLPTTDELARGGDQAPPKSPRDALAVYKDALADYRAGNYRDALGGFEQFLAARPSADYVDNALYWIGECHFGLGKFEDAMRYFQRVMAEQPDGNKVPDAMLKMSLAYDRTGRGDDAETLLQDLTRQYPATNAGRLASQKLAERQ